MTELHLGATDSTITGALSDLPASMTHLRLGGTSSTITGGAGAMAAVGIQQIWLQDTSLIEANVDNVLLRLYTDRANFTWATPILNIGGSNDAPSGIYQDGDPPTTGLEYVYEIANDPETEGINTWSVTYTGGTAP
jgi:hypothetical protein